MKMLTGLVLILSLCACTSPKPDPAPTPTPQPSIGCAAETAIAAAVATGFGALANCKNIASVQSAMMGALGKANLCVAAAPAEAKNRKGILGDMICPLATNTLVNLVTGKIPAEWECDPAAKVQDVATMVSAACSKAIGI